jgi:hypothetical protein
MRRETQKGGIMIILTFNVEIQGTVIATDHKEVQDNFLWESELISSIKELRTQYGTWAKISCSIEEPDS